MLNRTLYNKGIFNWFQMFSIAVKFENLMKWTMEFEVNCNNQMKIIASLSFCLGCWMFGMWDVWDESCWRCGMFGMWDVWNVKYLGYGMFWRRDAEYVGCSGCEMLGMWDVWDMGCEMLDVCRDVGCWFIKCS